MTLSRREWIVLSGAAFGNRILNAAPDRVPWYQNMRRCGQVNFNERDPIELNIDEWLDYWTSLKINALLLNAGGIEASHGVQQEDEESPQGDELEAPLGELIVARRVLMAARADGGGTLARPHGDLNALVIGSESCSVVDESPETVAAV